MVRFCSGGSNKKLICIKKVFQTIINLRFVVWFSLFFANDRKNILKFSFCVWEGKINVSMGNTILKGKFSIRYR